MPDRGLRGHLKIFSFEWDRQGGNGNRTGVQIRRVWTIRSALRMLKLLGDLEAVRGTVGHPEQHLLICDCLDAVLYELGG